MTRFPATPAMILSWGAYGNDGYIFGGLGNDTIVSGVAAENIVGGEGNDVIVGGEGNDTITGDAGDDSLVAGSGSDGFIFGGDGSDTIVSGPGAEMIYGGSDVDDNPLFSDWIIKEADVDMTLSDGLLMADGPAMLFGIERALLMGGDSANTLDARGFSGNVVLVGGAGDDSLYGGPGDDTLHGGAGDDYLEGGPGSDTYVYRGDEAGSDTIVEPPSNSGDTLDFTDFFAPIQLNLGTTDAQEVSPGKLALTLSSDVGIENVLGTAFSDVIVGSVADNVLDGGGGFDWLDGSAGDDVLRAGATRRVYLDFDSATELGEHNYSPFERDAIQAAMQQDYARFDVRFTQVKPLDGNYITVTFNQTPIINGRPQPGGESQRVGWRDLTSGGRVIVDVNAFLGDAVNQLTPSSENYISLSSTIASHELAHMLGIRHNDAFGAPGSGIYWATYATRFLPGYPGPTAADETPFHLIASPASVRTSLVDAMSDPFFGEREALKLAYAETGPTLMESDDLKVPAALGELPIMVQPLGELLPMIVPNTIEKGVNKNVTLNARAINVVGAIDLTSPTGPSESDYYSFQGVAGEVVTIEILSQILRYRIADTIDSVAAGLFRRCRCRSAGGLLLQLRGRARCVQRRRFRAAGRPSDRPAAARDGRVPGGGGYVQLLDSRGRHLPAGD